MTQTTMPANVIAKANHDLSCLSLLMKLAGSCASAGGVWSGVQISEFGSAIVWAALEINQRTDIIAAASEEMAS